MRCKKDEDGIMCYVYNSIEEKEKHIKNMKAIGYKIIATEGDLEVTYFRETEVKVSSLD